MATTINRSGVTLTDDTGTPAAPNLDGTALNNAWAQTFMDRIDALLTGATFQIAGLFDADGFGTHTFDAGGTGSHGIRVTNSAAGTTNVADVSVVGDSGAAVSLRQYASTFSSAGAAVADGGAVVSSGAGGLSLAASHASGAVRLFAGASERARVDGSGLSVGRTSAVSFGAPRLSLGGNLAFGGLGAGAGGAIYLLHDDTGGSEDGQFIGGNSGSLEIGRIVAGVSSNAIQVVHATGAVRVSSGVAAPGLASLDYISSGIGWPSSTQVDLYVAGTVVGSWSFGSSQAQFQVPSAAYGSGAVAGGRLAAGRNSSGSGAAGHLQLQAAGGTFYYLWIDATGDLRVHTAAPTANGSVSDTAGVVVGTQT